MRITTSDNEKFISIHLECDGERSLSWEEIQEVKSNLFPNLDFIEVYPKLNEVVNKANVRHLIHVKGFKVPYLCDLEIESKIDIYES